MVNPIGNGSAAAREAILAAVRDHAKIAERQQEQSVGGSLGSSTSSGAAGSVQGTDFRKALSEGIRSVESEIQSADNLAEDLVTGQINDIHQVAVRIKRADLSFRFALEVRNKLIDAYREVMRMNV
jgi:flagellar hook-basal body complex protein FliE